MPRHPRPFAFTAISIMLLCLIACSDDDDPTRPEPATPTPTPPLFTPTPTPENPEPYAADYLGQFTFNALPWIGDLQLTISNEGTLSGVWTGIDENGDEWELDANGYLLDTSLFIALSGYYGDFYCTVGGQAEGASTDGFQTFNGEFSIKTCDDRQYAGAWWAQRQK